MGRRAGALACVLLFAVAACSSDSKTSTSSGSGTTGGSSSIITVGVDGKDSGVNLGSLKYFPDALTVAAGSTVRFHGNFTGEPHTVALGTSIDKTMKIFSGLTDAEKQGPPPQAFLDLKIPLVFPDGPPGEGPPQLNQSAAQACVTKDGEFAPGAAACPTKSVDVFDGKESLVNSGIFKDGQNFDVKLADDLAAGTYSWICLFHGPEMHGALTVVAKGDKSAQSAADVDAAGKKQLADAVAKVKAAVDKANATSEPGKVVAAAAPEDDHAAFADMFFPKEVSIPVGSTVTWNLSFHTVTFNAPEDAHLAFGQASDGTWSLNPKAMGPAGYTPPAAPPSSDSASSAGTSSASSADQSPPPPTNIDGGSWDGTTFFNSGSTQAPGDVFFTVKFTKAGTYKYICTIHPDMEGTVKVA